LEWLRDRARNAGEFPNPEEFANTLAVDLNYELAKLSVSKPSDKGIGIHFTAYERLDDRWIPELFLISNWEGIPYTKIRSTGAGASRETYHTLKNIPSSREHGKLEFRLAVHEALQAGTLFYYNNGDPELFNPIAKAMFDSMNAFSQRGVLVDFATAKTHCNLVRQPVEVVSRLLIEFTRKERRIIGGRAHDLCVLSSGHCWSSTGDGHS
jgi:hypothetical protein